MKIGSLVELVDDSWKHYIINTLHGVVYPVKNKIYTVRSIETECGGVWLTLEELVNPYLHYANECGEVKFNINRFRELQPPIENIEEFINENTLQEVNLSK